MSVVIASQQIGLRSRDEARLLRDVVCEYREAISRRALERE
ncbi:hypothetical protein [Paraburkholderia sp. RL18-103-BIB-C]